MEQTDFAHLKVGDKVTRLLSGTVPMELVVTKIVSDDVMMCGNPDTGIGMDPDSIGTEREGWFFHRTYGYEIDERFGWGVPKEDGQIWTGSYLTLEKTS